MSTVPTTQEPSRYERDKAAHAELCVQLDAIAAHFTDWDDGYDPPEIVHAATEAARVIRELRCGIYWRDESLRQWALICDNGVRLLGSPA